MRSTRDQIVEAALRCFARDGFGVALRPIGEEAGVSAALIVHHFGSKAGLRAAVDDHVLGIAEEKLRVFDAGGADDAIAFLVALVADGALPRYISRVLAEGDEAGRRLFESFVDVTEKALAGLSLGEPRLTAALLVTHSLGLMVLSEHVEAATGVHPYRGDMLRVTGAALQIYSGALRPMLP